MALNVPLHLIRPYGFSLDEKAVRRAGLDYWKYVTLKEFENFEDFLEKEAPPREKLFFFSRFGQKSYFEAPFTKGCYLIFGAETKGLPKDLHEKYEECFYTVPMFSPYIRSLNLSNCATAVAYEAFRQIAL